MNDAAPPRTTPAPRPLPPAWERAVANSIAARLRKPWTPARVLRSTRPNPTGYGRHVGSIPTPEPTTYLVREAAWAAGIIDPNPTLNTPCLLWHLDRLNLAHALAAENLLQHHATVDTWLKARTPSGPPPSPYRLTTNRHGTPKLRRDGTSLEITRTFDTAARTATILIADYDDVLDWLAEHADPIDHEALWKAVARQEGVPEFDLW